MHASARILRRWKPIYAADPASRSSADAHLLGGGAKTREPARCLAHRAGSRAVLGTYRRGLRRPAPAESLCAHDFQPQRRALLSALHTPPKRWPAQICASRHHPRSLTVPAARHCLPHQDVAAPQSETDFWLGTDATGCGRGGRAGCLLVVAVAHSSRWLFGRADVRGSTTAVALFIGYVSPYPAASADCFLLCESLAVETTCHDATHAM